MQTIEEDEQVQEPFLAQSALDSDITVGEPRIAQLDNIGDFRITRLLYKWADRLNPNTGEKERVPVDVRYPDIENALGTLLSHLNMVMNYTFEERCSQIISARKKIIAPLKFKYRRDNDALQILSTAEEIHRRNVIESGSGSHQAYIGRLMGAHRTVETIQPQQEKRKRWI